MGIKAFAFKTFFGGKPWYKSMVGWGLVVLAVAETAVPMVGEMGLADPEKMGVVTSYMEKLAAALAALGIRRKLPATGTIAAVSLVALLSLGCVTAYTQCDYDVKTTKLTEVTGWSNVIGKGDVDNTVMTCKNIFHDSIDTGLDAGTLQAIQALSKIAPPAAAASALTDIREALDSD